MGNNIIIGNNEGTFKITKETNGSASNISLHGCAFKLD